MYLYVKTGGENIQNSSLTENRVGKDSKDIPEMKNVFLNE